MISGRSGELLLQTKMGIGQATWLLTAAGSAKCHALVFKSYCWKWLVQQVVGRRTCLSTLRRLVSSIPLLTPSLYRKRRYHIMIVKHSSIGVMLVKCKKERKLT